MSARLGWLAVLAISLVGCPHQPPPGDAGVHDAPMSIDAGPPQLETVSFAVLDQDGVVGGAMLFVDDANGMRHVATADAGGLATITDVAWTPGAISITSVADHHAMQSLVGFRRADLGDRVDATGTITMQMRRDVDSARVSGNLLHTTPSDGVTVSADVPSFLTASNTGSTPLFGGVVMAGVPFHVFALEGGFTMQTPFTETYVLRSLVQVPHDAIDGAATFDIDLATSVALDSVSGTILLPMDGTALSHTYASLNVSTDESELAAVLGHETSMQNVSNGVLAYNAQFAHAIDGTPVTVLSISASGSYARVAVDGVPGAMPIASSGLWPAPPVLATPANDASAMLHDPITLRSVDPTAPILATIDAADVTWTIELPAGATSFRVPQVPDGVDTSSWTGIDVRLESCQRWAGHRTRCSRLAGGQGFSATL